MKNQALFYSKDKSKKLKCRLLQFLFGALRVKLVSVFSITDLILSSPGWFVLFRVKNEIFQIFKHFPKGIKF